MLTGIILAGGENRRMNGKNKALLTFSNERLIERQIRFMKPICDEIIVVTNDPRSLLPILGNTVRIITDYIPGKGPLSGMHAAFTLSKSSVMWVVGCDMPFISHRAAEWMWKQQQELQCDAVIPYISNKYHSLHGIYHKNCIHAISDLLNQNQYQLKELFKNIRYERIKESQFLEQGIDPQFITAVNTPEDYNEALKIEASSHYVS